MNLLFELLKLKIKRKKRWEELFKRDFGERLLKGKESVFKEFLKRIEKEKKESWKEKYKRMFIAVKEESFYKKYLSTKVPFTPIMFGEPICNPFVEHHKTGKLPSLSKLSNYISVTYMALFQPIWLWFFTLEISSHRYDWYSDSSRAEKKSGAKAKKIYAAKRIGRRIAYLLTPLLVFTLVAPIISVEIYRWAGFVPSTLTIYRVSVRKQKSFF